MCRLGLTLQGDARHAPAIPQQGVTLPGSCLTSVHCCLLRSRGRRTDMSILSNSLGNGSGERWKDGQMGSGESPMVPLAGQRGIPYRGVVDALCVTGIGDSSSSAAPVVVVAAAHIIRYRYSIACGPCVCSCPNLRDGGLLASLPARVAGGGSRVLPASHFPRKRVEWAGREGRREESLEDGTGCKQEDRTGQDSGGSK